MEGSDTGGPGRQNLLNGCFSSGVGGRGGGGGGGGGAGRAVGSGTAGPSR